MSRAANDLTPPTYEESEQHLYRAQLLEEAGRFADCLEYLTNKSKEILDKTLLSEKRGNLLLRLGKNEEAEKEYRRLLSINPDNFSYHGRSNRVLLV